MYLGPSIPNGRKDLLFDRPSLAPPDQRFRLQLCLREFQFAQYTKEPQNYRDETWKEEALHVPFLLDTLANFRMGLYIDARIKHLVFFTLTAA